MTISSCWLIWNSSMDCLSIYSITLNDLWFSSFRMMLLMKQISLRVYQKIWSSSSPYSSMRACTKIWITYKTSQSCSSLGFAHSFSQCAKTWINIYFQREMRSLAFTFSHRAVLGSSSPSSTTRCTSNSIKAPTLVSLTLSQVLTRMTKSSMNWHGSNIRISYEESSPSSAKKTVNYWRSQSPAFTKCKINSLTVIVSCSNRRRLGWEEPSNWS